MLVFLMFTLLFISSDRSSLCHHMLSYMICYIPFFKIFTQPNVARVTLSHFNSINAIGVTHKSHSREHSREHFREQSWLNLEIALESTQRTLQSALREHVRSHQHPLRVPSYLHRKKQDLEMYKFITEHIYIHRITILGKYSNVSAKV